MSSGFLLSSFPAPPTHVPTPCPKFLPTTFLVTDNPDMIAIDANGRRFANGNGGDVEVYTTVADLSSYSPSPIMPFIRSRSSSAASSLVPFPLSSIAAPSPASPISPSNLGVTVGLCSGPPPALPLPPLPTQPSPIFTDDRITFACASYNINKPSARSLRSSSSVKSSSSVGSVQSLQNRVDSSQSIRSLTNSEFAPPGSRSDSDSDSPTTGTRPDTSSCATPTKKTASYPSSPSVREYEESIFDVELDFDAASSDDDQIMIRKSGTHLSSKEEGRENLMAFPLSSHQPETTLLSLPPPPPPPPLATNSSQLNTNPSPFTRIISAVSINYPGNSELGSPLHAVQTRSRSGTLTSVSFNSHSNRRGDAGVKGLKSLNLDNSIDKPNLTYSTNLGLSSRIRTYSQPSSVSSDIAKHHIHFHSQSHPVPPQLPSSTRVRASSSVSTSPRARNISQASSSTSKSLFVFDSIAVKIPQNLHPSAAMSTSASVPLPPPIDVTEDRGSGAFTMPLTPNPPSTPSNSSDTFEEDEDRSTSPDIQTLLSHTTEVLRSGGRVRSTSRPASRSRSVPRYKPEDKIRTSSMLSFGSKRSTGSGSAESGRSAAIIPSPKESRSQPYSHTFGSSKQKSQSRIRLDSKSSFMSKTSTDRAAVNGLSARSGPSSVNAIAGPSSSRDSLMNSTFDDEQNAFRDDDDDTEQDREEDAFSFFNPNTSSRSHRQQGHVEDDSTLKLSFPVIEDDDDIIDLKTPLPHLLLRAGVLSPHSKLLPSKVGSSDEEDLNNPRGRGRGKGRVSPVDSLISSTTSSSKHPRDARDTAKRRVRHKDGKLLRGGIGLTTGLGWSDSEDEDAPSELTTRLKRLASMGGLSALSRKSSMASNMSGYGETSSMMRSHTSGYGSLYGGGSSYKINGHGHTAVSQSGSAGRSSTYTTYTTTDNASIFKRGSVYSDISAGTEYSNRMNVSRTYANGAMTPAISRTPSRNVSRQSSFSSVPLQHSQYQHHHGQKDAEIIEEDEDYSILMEGKERGRKTASMVHVAEIAITENKAATAVTTLLAISTSSPLHPERNSTMSISSISSTNSMQSTNSLSLNPPSIAGSATPTPGTPTTPTPISSFSACEPSSNAINASSSSSTSSHPPSARQPTRLNTSHFGGASIVGRPHSPVPPPSPAPTGPLPPTPGMGESMKGKIGSTNGLGVSAIAAPVASKSTIPTSNSRLGFDSPSETILAISISASSSHSPLQFASQSPTFSAHLPSSSQTQHPSTNLVRVTSPTPSFSMPTGSRTIHPPRSRAGSLSSSKGFTMPPRSKESGSISSIGSLGTSNEGGGDKGKGRLPYVVEDDGAEKDEKDGGGVRSKMLDASDIVNATMDQVLPSKIDIDAIAIVEMEPSEYGDDVAVALTCDEDTGRTKMDSETIPSGYAILPSAQMQTQNDNSQALLADVDIQPIPEYPYRFDMPPPSPVISVNSGSFGFKRNDRSRAFQQSVASSSPLSSLPFESAKSSASSSSPSVAFSPARTSTTTPRQHEPNASISSLDTSESTMSFIAGRLDHTRMDSWNQNFSVFGSGMGVPPPDDMLGRKLAGTSSGLTSISKPQMLRNHSYNMTTTATPASVASPSSSAPPATTSLLSRATSPILARARAASPVSAISSMRVGSSLGFASSATSSSIPLSSSSISTLNGASTRRPTTPSSQLGLTSFSQRARVASPVPPSNSVSTNTASKLPSAMPHNHQPLTPAPRKSSLPLPPSFFTSPGRPTSPPPPPSSAAGHMPSLLLRPPQGNSANTGASAGGLPRKGGIPRPSTSPSPSLASTSSTSILPSSRPIPTPSPSPLSTSTKMASIPSRSSSATPHRAATMLPQPGGSKKVGAGKRNG